MNKVKMPKIPKVDQPIFTDDDITRLLAVCDNARDRAIILFLIDTGVRGAELLKLNVEDVDLKRGAVLVRQGKQQKDRTTYASARTVKQLLRYLSMRSAEGKDPLFTSLTRNSRLGRGGLMQMMRKLGRDAGVHPCTAHMARRFWAVKCLKNGMDVFHLQRLGGWEDMQTMKRYIILADVDLEDAAKTYGVVDSLFG